VSPIDLTVIVVNYNTRDLLATCLQSVATTARALRHEVIVVDNGSGDGSVELVAAQFPRVRLLRNAANRGFAAANNQAIAVSRGRYLLLLNSDAVLLPGAAAALVAHMDAHPGVGVAGAQLLNPDGSFQYSYADFPTLVGEVLLLTRLARLFRPSTFPSYPPEQSREVRSVDWVNGACLLARRAAVEAVGPLDETYFMYTEETDWCYRMRQSGWGVSYLPQARALHWGSQSARKQPERRRWQVYRSKWLFLRKHRGPAAATAFLAAVRLSAVLKLVVWACTGLGRDVQRRDRARQQVRSYAFLLGQH